MLDGGVVYDQLSMMVVCGLRKCCWCWLVSESVDGVRVCRNVVRQTNLDGNIPCHYMVMGDNSTEPSVVLGDVSRRGSARLERISFSENQSRSSANTASAGIMAESLPNAIICKFQN